MEATQVVAGKPMADIQTPTKGQVMAQWIAGSRAVRASPPKRHLDPDRPIAFVAVDLLSIDGSSLLDVPLLERKRLLDSALTPGELVRVTPFVQAPGGSFVTTWRGLGFSHLAYKAVNSRYTPDLRNNDWSILPMPCNPARSFIFWIRLTPSISLPFSVTGIPFSKPISM